MGVSGEDGEGGNGCLGWCGMEVGGEGAVGWEWWKG